MAAELFPFMRATYYRWAQVFSEVGRVVADAPEIMAVGDLHVENFGSWRDAEGRLIWGINDFDEAHTLPYTHDLVRLALSAQLAIRGAHLSLKTEDAFAAVLRGYAESLEAGGAPFVLGEHHGWLREMATGALREPAVFWQKLDALPAREPKEEVPKSALAGIRRLLPEKDLNLRLVHRTAGLGSLGRQRFVAIAEYRGGRIAREAKAAAPSAAVFASGGESEPIHYNEIIDRAVRVLDPYVQVRDGWVVRRLAPDCSRIELGDLPKSRDEIKLLHAMGWETANLHLGTRSAGKQIRKHLATLPKEWLHDAVKAMAHQLETDWHTWKETYHEEQEVPTTAT
jgi:hypothetical protein